MWIPIAHPDLRRLRPRLRVERTLEVGRNPDRVAGALEGEEHAVARPVDLAPAVQRRGPDELADPGAARPRTASPRASRRLVEPSTSANSSVTVPVGSPFAGGAAPFDAEAGVALSSSRRSQVERRILTQDLPARARCSDWLGSSPSSSTSAARACW